MNQPTLNHNLDNVQMTVLMTELIDMFMLYLMFLLYYAIVDPARLRHRDDGVYRYVRDD